jgi:hypothetical protein
MKQAILRRVCGGERQSVTVILPTDWCERVREGDSFPPLKEARRGSQKTILSQSLPPCACALQVSE